MAVLTSPPLGVVSWDDCSRSIGVPEDERGVGADRIEDPNAASASRPRWRGSLLLGATRLRTILHEDLDH